MRKTVLPFAPIIVATLLAFGAAACGVPEAQDQIEKGREAEKQVEERQQELEKKLKEEQQKLEESR